MSAKIIHYLLTEFVIFLAFQQMFMNESWNPFGVIAIFLPGKNSTKGRH